MEVGEELLEVDLEAVAGENRNDVVMSISAHGGAWNGGLFEKHPNRLINPLSDVAEAMVVEEVVEVASEEGEDSE